MRENVSYPNYHEYFEYHGNTEIERTRQSADKIIERDWLVFNSVDEAMEYFNEKNSQLDRYYN